MDDKVKGGIEKIEAAAEKCNSFITGSFDKYLPALKAHGDVILGAVERIASRFSVLVMLVCGLLFTILCLKNMVFSFFFKDAPANMCFSMAFGSLISLAIWSYAATKMLDALATVISSSNCKISSRNFFSVLTAIGLLETVTSFIGGIFLTCTFRSLLPLFYGLAATVLFALITLYTANTEKFGIVEDATASAGEDFVTIFTFLLKVMLRLVPVALLVISIIGIVQIVPMIFTTYINFGEKNNTFMTMRMVADMTYAVRFVFIGIVPLAVYLVYIFNYVALDIIRAILQLPNKLDELKK